MSEPLNTEWNRKTGILTGKGQIGWLGLKHGIAYFTWTDLHGNILFLHCDEGVFKKHFSLNGINLTNTNIEPHDKLAALQQNETKFLKYPFEVL